MKYNILTRKHLTEFIGIVEANIDEGWRPVGGAFCDADHFYQTMILIEPEPEHPKPTTEQLIKVAMRNLTDDPEMPPTSTAQQP